MTTIFAPPGKANKWQMGFNSAFKGLIDLRNKAVTIQKRRLGRLSSSTMYFLLGLYHTLVFACKNFVIQLGKALQVNIQGLIKVICAIFSLSGR